MDVADVAAVDAAAGRVEEKPGPLDVWVNAAFTTVFAPADEVRPEELERATEVTYFGFVYGTQAALRRRKPRDRGTIVQVGSALAQRGVPLQSVYCGAKHAIQGFTDSLRCELLHDRSGVRVTMAQLPGHPRPVAPVYQPEVAARRVLHAVDHAGRREHWTGGSTVATLIGQRVAPALPDRCLARTGYDSQQTGEPVDPARRPVNLYRPPDDGTGTDFGTHGAFDDEAHPRSLQLWFSRHRGVVVAGAGAGAAAGLVGAAVVVLGGGVWRRG